MVRRCQNDILLYDFLSIYFGWMPFMMLTFNNADPLFGQVITPLWDAERNLFNLPHVDVVDQDAAIGSLKAYTNNIYQMLWLYLLQHPKHETFALLFIVIIVPCLLFIIQAAATHLVVNTCASVTTR